jgi:hypothetical protein
MQIEKETNKMIYQNNIGAIEAKLEKEQRNSALHLVRGFLDVVGNCSKRSRLVR